MDVLVHLRFLALLFLGLACFLGIVESSFQSRVVHETDHDPDECEGGDTTDHQESGHGRPALGPAPAALPGAHRPG